MNPLTLSIPVNNPPLCPICFVELLGHVIRVYGGVVFCHRCINSTRYHILNRIIRRCRSTRFAEFFSTHSGIIVLNPKSTCRRSSLSALAHFEQTDDDYDYPQFIGIVPDDYFRPHPGPPDGIDDPRHIEYMPGPLDGPHNYADIAKAGY